MAFSLGIFRRDRYSSISSCGLLFTRDAYFVYFLHSTESPVSVNTCSNVTIILIPNWINPLQIQVSAKEVRPLPKPNYRRNPRSAIKPRPNASFAFHWYVNRTVLESNQQQFLLSLEKKANHARTFAPLHVHPIPCQILDLHRIEYSPDSKRGI